MSRFLHLAISIGFPTLLAVHGFRKKSLSLSGAAAAFMVGVIMLGGQTKVFGIALVGFYACGSFATKYGKKRKALLEEGYSEYGNRTGWQVLCNSLAALSCCIAWNVISEQPRESCIIQQGTLSRVFVFGALGHFGCCLGDTLASELGILASSSPRLITTFKPVPPGTNGGISLGGTLASAAGGLIMGVIMALSVANQCGFPWEMLIWGVASGFGGSMLDSLLGATVQETRWSDAKKKVANDGKLISGYNLLSNNQVNLVSSILTSVCISVLQL